MREYKRICLTVSAPKRPFCVNEPNSRKFVDIREKKSILSGKIMAGKSCTTFKSQV